MKVALVSFDFGEYSVRLASALASEVQVSLQMPDELASGYLADLDPRVQFRPFTKPRLRQAAQQVRTISTIVGYLRRFDPDVIHVQQGHLWFNLALPLLGRYPIVLTVHDPRHHLGDKGAQKTPQAVTDFGYRRAKRIIVHSQQLKQLLVQALGIHERDVDVVSHIALGNKPVDGHVLDGDGARVLFFGRIWEYKGLEYLIRAEPLITSAVPEARIIIAGQGEDFGRYRRLMVNPSHFIVRNEYVSDDTRSDLFQQASVVVLPYVEASQSGVLPLAYRFGKPVVATTVGGLPEMVEHGRTGYLVPPRDEVALAEAIVRVLQNGDLRRQLGAAGSDKLDRDCSPHVVARQTLAVYRRALDTASAAAGGLQRLAR
jgi:glycosyltransferase involved in cell wall biosynthesis